MNQPSTTSEIINLISDIISILTPVVLLFWFYYSQRTTLSKNYYNQLLGNYGGFVPPTDRDKTVLRRLNCGIRLRIKDIDTTGYFRGDFDHCSREMTSKNNRSQSINWYYAKLNYSMFHKMFSKIYPYKLKKNKRYVGKFYVISCMHYDFEPYHRKEDYVRAEYDIIHYREIQAIEFNLKKKYGEEELFPLPNNFTLYKSVGYNFEPYEAVTKTVFIDW